MLVNENGERWRWQSDIQPEPRTEVIHEVDLMKVLHRLQSLEDKGATQPQDQNFRDDEMDLQNSSFFSEWYIFTHTHTHTHTH